MATWVFTSEWKATMSGKKVSDGLRKTVKASLNIWIVGR